MAGAEPMGKSGGVALFWNNLGDVKLMSMSRFHIDVSVVANNDKCWRLTGLYGLCDMDILGHQCTWERGRNTNYWIEIRLDRVLANAKWLELFLTVKVYNLEGSPSDHSPLLLVPESQHKWVKKHKFRFENAWLLEPACFQIVKDYWEDHVTHNVMHKLSNCAESLQVWGCEITGCFQKRIKDCKGELKVLRNKRDTQYVEEYEATKK
ncbi:uncharacterized protein LOC141691545 [Apium graveolens]|uniref:uncharacterized protein LOC141691545 n=1 Tax=Apium graveolens TaxID=4045 RepID=UPI003D7A4224